MAEDGTLDTGGNGDDLRRQHVLEFVHMGAVRVRKLGLEFTAETAKGCDADPETLQKLLTRYEELLSLIQPLQSFIEELAESIHDQTRIITGHIALLRKLREGEDEEGEESS